ncbi:hypothetical protein LG3211_0435 [Lysobacter gummosus]|nr:hypothetical protein LG3211_0435 [Lysobacter gummosus]
MTVVALSLGAAPEGGRAPTHGCGRSTLRVAIRVGRPSGSARVPACVWRHA